jgi:Amt family ammonium transporter
MDNGITALQLLSAETCHWVAIMFVFPIHVGFCAREVGVSRRKNHLATPMKNATAIPASA